MAAPDRAVTLKQFAKLLDVSPGYITELKQAGRLVLDDAGRVLVDASRRLIRETADPAKAGVRGRHAARRGKPAAAASAGVPVPDVSPVPAEDADALALPPMDPIALRRARALAEKAEAEVRDALRRERVEIGQLLPADDVEHAVRAAIATLRSGLENLPAILAPQVAAEGDEAKCRVLMTDAIEHALEELARQFTAIGKVDA